ncbi:MAG: hypothetical protein AAFR58_20460, partial [Cyanobacteria bacterium J06627_28]
MEFPTYTTIAALGQIVNLTLTLLAIAVPILCVLKGYRFFKTNLISIPIICAIVILGAYLADAYPLIQLHFMGFDFDGLSDTERLRAVEPASRALATELYGSIFGIGWPLKAIFAMVMVLPYPAAVWTVITLAKSVIKKA